jgi:hypothetical protein
MNDNVEGFRLYKNGSINGQQEFIILDWETYQSCFQAATSVSLKFQGRDWRCWAVKTTCVDCTVTPNITPCIQIAQETVQVETAHWKHENSKKEVIGESFSLRHFNLIAFVN